MRKGPKIRVRKVFLTKGISAWDVECPCCNWNKWWPTWEIAIIIAFAHSLEAHPTPAPSSWLFSGRIN